MKWLFSKLELGINFLIKRIRTLMGQRGSHVVVPYTGYANLKQVHLMGRVVEEFHPHDFTKDFKRIQHFYQVVKLFLTFKVPNRTVYIKINEELFEAKTNHQGYFYKTVTLKTPLDPNPKEEGRHRVYYSLEPFSGEPKRVWPGRYSLPEEDTKLLVVSDVDDTIIKSRATSFLQIALRTLLYPVDKRKTFDEASQFYNELQQGHYTGLKGLFFYVSSSTWNIYPVLSGFLEHNQFPEGSLILNDNQTKSQVEGSELKHQHKKDRIEEIMSLYPNFKVLLIGDAGQEDPKLYLSLAKKYGERVFAILIRESWWHSKFSLDESFRLKAKKMNIPFYSFQSLTELEDELSQARP